VKSLKALSRNADNDPKVIVSLDNVIRQSLDIVEQRCRLHDIKLIWTASENEISILAREAELMQVFTNLLGNAMDAVKSLDEKWIEIKIEELNNQVDVLFIDAGRGIPQEVQKKIMEPFFTTKDVNQGTGLGLSISKNIIKNHDGELALIPEAAHTTFKVRLPVIHE
jgi:C4-dicarboxylate-specific signal transduction histidine kinase